MLAPGAVVDIGRTRQRDLGRGPRHPLEESEVARVLAARPGDLRHHPGDAARHAVAVRARCAPALGLRHRHLDAGQARGRETVGIGVAPELAVGHDLEAERFLAAHHVADGGVLGRAELAGIAAPRLELGPRRQQLGRAQQAADMFGAEGRERWEAWHRIIICRDPVRRNGPLRYHDGNGRPW